MDLRVDVTLRRGPDFQLALEHDFPLAGVTALFGPSGCGKTTLLRILAGLEREARGRVSVGDEVWQCETTFLPAHRRGAGLVFQDVRLFGDRSVEKNLRFAERRARGASPEIHFDPVVDALDLEGLLARAPDSLSGGERQRVAIGRTLLTRPRLLLMDEPLAALDVGRKEEVLDTIARLPSAFGVPIIYVTHAVDEVARLADQMVVLAEGSKRLAGATREVLAHLDIATEADGFEASSLLEATVVGHDSHYHLTRLDFLGQPLVMPAAPFEVGDRVRLRLRARDIALATARPSDISIRNRLEGRVGEIEQSPDSPYANVTILIGGIPLHARVTREAVDTLGLRRGMPAFALIKSIAVDRRMKAEEGSLREPDRPMT